MSETSAVARRLAWALVVVVGVAVILLAWGRREQIEAGVTVFVDAVPIECPGSVVESGSINDDARILHLVTIEPEMTCNLRFFVANNTGHDIAVQSILLPVTGPAGGPAIVATRLNPTTTSNAGPAPGEVDAIWDRNDTLMPGEIGDYQITIEFRPGGCSADGGIMTLGTPTVRIRAWFMHVDIGNEFMPVGFLGSPASSC